MTPQEKAEEIVDKYFNASFNCKECNEPYCDIKCTMLTYKESKECALISIDLAMENDNDDFFNRYWKEVKQEIEKL